MSRIVYGANPVRELVTARPKDVTVVYLLTGDTGPAIKQVKQLASDRGVTVEERERGELDALTGAGAVHQGVVAITGEFAYAELEDVLDELEERQVAPLLVVLDSVQDPRNLGAIIRSAHVLGAHAVVIARDRAAGITPVAVKSSAGATEHLPIAQVTNIAQTLGLLKERGVWTVGAVARQAPPPWKVDLKGPIALVLGAEGKGLRPLVDKTCDLHVEIPMTGKVASLNVSVAAGVLLYEASRQRA
jgi:23S rRNA (guanosine2251-2'-O)-methyltransferase